jgi:hypothetical protein
MPGMKLKPALIALVCLFLMLAPAKGYSSGTTNAAPEVATTCFLSSLLTIYEDGIVPAPVSVAEPVPVPVCSPYPLVKVSASCFIDNPLLHQRLAYYSLEQPVLYHAAPPLYIANRLLLI